MLAMTMSKKLLFRDPQAEHELKVYAVALCALLVVRIPLIRRLLKQVPFILARRHKLVQPIPVPDGGVELMPKVHGRESGVSVRPTFIIPNEILSLSEQGSFVEPFGRINEALDFYANSPPEEEAEGQEAVTE